MPDLLNVPSFLLALLTLLLTIGGFFALRHGSLKQAQEVEERVINALNAEIAVQGRKIKALEEDRDKQNRVFDAVRYLLQQQGWTITIDGERVTIEDRTGKSKITRIQDKMPKPPADEDAI